jgi:hypothetical protein
MSFNERFLSSFPLESFHKLREAFISSSNNSQKTQVSLSEFLIIAKMSMENSLLTDDDVKLIFKVFHLLFFTSFIFC